MKNTRILILLAALPLAATLLTGCGSPEAAPVANAVVDPQAAAKAGQAGVASDLASQQARANAQQKGQAAVAAEQAKGTQ